MDNKPAVKQTGRYRLQYRGTECTNCGHPLDMSDRYCPSCSQANSTKKLTLKDFFDEFFASLISYDSKLLKTLTALVLRPGQITKDYVAGKRVSYTNPFRFLLSLAIVYFLMFNFSAGFEDLDENGVGKTKAWFNEDGSLTVGGESAMAYKNEDARPFKGLDTLGISVSILKSDSLILKDPKAYFKNQESEWLVKRVFKKREFFSAVFRNVQIYDQQEIFEKYDLADADDNRAAFSMATSLRRFQQNPGSYLSKFVSKLPFALFLFQPLFAFFIWMVYIRKKYTYTDHLIFSFHNQALLLILLIISFIVSEVINFTTGWLFIIVFAIYLFLAMRKFYEQGFFKTLFKYVFLNSIFVLLAMSTLFLLFFVGLFTY